MGALLLTGRTGFVGRALAPLLKRRRRVVSLLRNPAPGLDLEGETVLAADCAELDAAMLEPLGVDTVVHAAARLRGRPSQVSDENARMTEAVAAAAGRLGLRVILVGSLNARFARALGPYARAKAAAEEALRAAGRPFLAVRTPLVLGPGSPSARAAREFHGRWGFFPVLGGGSGLVQPVPVRALAEAVAGFESEPARSGVVEVVGRRTFAYREVLAGLIGPGCRLVPTPLGATLAALRALETLGLALPASSEEVASINMDKTVDPSVPGVVTVENPVEELFSRGG